MTREVKNSFQQRLANAILPGDMVGITRFAPNMTEEHGYFKVWVRVHDQEFGDLEEHGNLPVEKATPGGLVKIVEELAGKIHSGIKLVRDAKDRAAR